MALLLSAAAACGGQKKDAPAKDPLDGTVIFEDQFTAMQIDASAWEAQSPGWNRDTISGTPAPCIRTDSSGASGAGIATLQSHQQFDGSHGLIVTAELQIETDSAPTEGVTLSVQTNATETYDVVLYRGSSPKGTGTFFRIVLNNNQIGPPIYVAVPDDAEFHQAAIVLNPDHSVTFVVNGETLTNISPASDWSMVHVSLLGPVQNFHSVRADDVRVLRPK